VPIVHRPETPIICSSLDFPVNQCYDALMARLLLAPIYIEQPNKTMTANVAFILSFELQTIYRAIQMFDDESTVCAVIAQTLGVEYATVKDFLRTPMKQGDEFVKRVNKVVQAEFPKEERPRRLVDLI
jgi:hypothetical protein